MPEWSDLPPEVIDVIISHCEAPAVLQLRLVSRRLNSLVISSDRLAEVLQDVLIILTPSTLERFVEEAPPSLPFSNFNIEVSTPRGRFVLSPGDWDFYTNSSFQTFREKFCPRIRKLRLSGMFCCTLDLELEFFTSLQSLKELQIIKLWFPPSDEPRVARVPFAEINRVMTRFTVNHERNSGEYLVEWIKMCPSLEDIRVPNSDSTILWGLADRTVEVGSTAFHQARLNHAECFPYILRLGAEGHLQNLKRLDMNGRTMRLDLCGKEDLRFLQKMLANTNMRLENVSNSFLEVVGQVLPLETVGNFRQKIFSFRGISESLMEEGLENLEVLSFIGGVEDPEEGSVWNIDLEASLRLPGLKTIEGIIGNTIESAQETQNTLEKVFLPNEPRLSVTELDIKQSWLGIADPLQPVRFEPEYLDLSFPNLTRLVFQTNCFTKGELERLIEVISRKAVLEELTLGTSKGVPQTAFFGGNPDESPIFLRLKNLKKLRLNSSWRWGCDDFEESERMDDGMLELLSLMNLTHLQIIGEGWRTVTSEGVRKLVDGPFGRSVLWVRLNCLEGTDELSESLEMLSKVAHRNRVATGLTSTLYEECKASEETLVGKGGLRSREWIHEVVDMGVQGVYSRLRYPSSVCRQN